jgi:dienelactone hydrolase
MKQTILGNCAMLLTILGPCLISAHADDVSWLQDVQQPPREPSPFSVGTMLPLLERLDGTQVSSLNDWKERRKELQSAWETFLGPSPKFPKNTDVTVLKHETIGEITRDLIRYQCEQDPGLPDLYVEAYLLRPVKNDIGKGQPGIVALHHTATASIDEIAGISGRPALFLGPKLAERGFVVICPRCFLWQNASSLPQAVEAFRERHPQSLGMRKMLFDAQRATDILVAQPGVDRARIGAIGHSLGAKEVLYLAAFDDRIKAAVASEGGIGLRSTNWDAPWYLGPQIHENTFARNHHELLALIAPRAILILGGETGPGAADGDRSWPLISSALPVHRLYRANPRLGILNHHQGHSFSEDLFERSANWLETYLKNDKSE